MDEQPQWPLSPMAEGMVSLHELYLESRKVGFTEAQSMQIVIATLLGASSK